MSKSADRTGQSKPRSASPSKGRVIRYVAIADALETRIDAGEFAPGQLLPSEAVLSNDYEASRETIRRSLEALRERGLVRSRQGYGWFVAADPLQQSLGRLGTIEAQLEERGLASERRVIDFGFIDAPQRVREVLGVDRVLRVSRVNLADGLAFARVTVWCPEEIGADFSRAAVESSTIYDLLPTHPASAIQVIVADAIDASDAQLLGVPEGSPALKCERTSRAANGTNLLVSEHVFASHLTEFVVELPHVATSVAPTGLRLVR